MHISSSFIVSTAITFLGVASTVNASPLDLERRDMAYRDNAVTFKTDQKGITGPTIKSGSFKITDLSITPGSDPQRLNKIDDVKSWSNIGSASQQVLEFQVGRKGSEGPARFFFDQTSRRNTFADKPMALNFAFKGDLTLELYDKAQGKMVTATFGDITLGQGHSAGTNNWWFGGRNCANARMRRRANTVKCHGTDETGNSVIFDFKTGGNSQNEILIIGSRDNQDELYLYSP